MFGISGEHLIILAIVLLILGPRRLPELGNTLGKAIKNFKDAIGGVEEAKFRHIDDSKTTAKPEAMAGAKTDTKPDAAPGATPGTTPNAADNVPKTESSDQDKTAKS